MGAVEEWWASYHGKIRAALPDETLFLIGGRGVVRDDRGRLLLIKRADTGIWAFPAGGMEIGESMVDCAIRETYEETGLKAGQATPFALYTGPDHIYTNVFDHTYQHIILACLLTDVTGELNPDPEEATDAGFFHPDEFPNQSRTMQRTLADLEAFERTGRVQIS
ncbi:MAG: NUDIX domain-containing protein [Hamadaea sp.]|nr:NUDIX domain-containing protein [Hamadaea sp.]